MLKEQDNRVMTTEQLLAFMESLPLNNNIFTINGDKDFSLLKAMTGEAADADTFANLMYEDDMGEDRHINVKYENIIEISVHNRTKTMTVSYSIDGGEDEDEFTIDVYKLTEVDPTRGLKEPRQVKREEILEIENFVESEDWKEWIEDTPTLNLNCVTYNALIHLKLNIIDSLTLAGKPVPEEIDEQFKYLLGEYEIV